MNKTDFAHLVADKSGMKIYEIESVLNAFCEAVGEVLASGDNVKLVGFGTFEMVRRQATVGRNPRNGQVVKIPATNVAKFKPGKFMKETLNGVE
jgi:DNA-binding protein HU-beta